MVIAFGHHFTDVAQVPDKLRLGSLFREVTLVGTIPAGADAPAWEQQVPIWVCRGPAPPTAGYTSTAVFVIEAVLRVAECHELLDLAHPTGRRLVEEYLLAEAREAGAEAVENAD